MDTNIRITIVYDNEAYQSGLAADWGFACVINIRENVILFDTGADARILLSNMHRLGIPPTDIGQVVLSHAHYDHTGGLAGFLQHNKTAAVTFPASFPADFQEQLDRGGIKTSAVRGPTAISEHIFSTGELGRSRKEQSLIIRTGAGLLLITGCAHPGIVNIIKAAAASYEDPILLVMGGFHLNGMSRDELDAIIDDFKKLGVQQVCPCHCTGDAAKQRFKTVYDARCLAGGAGRVITLKSQISSTK